MRLLGREIDKDAIRGVPALVAITERENRLGGPHQGVLRVILVVGLLVDVHEEKLG